MGVEAVNLARDDLPLEIEDRGSEREVEKRLLAVAEGVEPPFQPVGRSC